jgi:hypothetical protein
VRNELMVEHSDYWEVSLCRRALWLVTKRQELMRPMVDFLKSISERVRAKACPDMMLGHTRGRACCTVLV